MVVVEQKISFRHKISPILSSQIEGRKKKLATIFLFFTFAQRWLGVVSYCMAVLRSASPFQYSPRAGERVGSSGGGQCSIREYMYTFTHGQSAFTEVTLSRRRRCISCRVAADTRQQRTLYSRRVEGKGQRRGGQL